MKKDVTYLTKADLKALGFSVYLIKVICKGLTFVQIKSGVRRYNCSDLKEAVMNKLSQTKIQPQTRESLQVVLSLVDDKSNVIEVDFLGKLTLEQRIDFLKKNREKLRTNGEAILQDVNQLLKQAKT